jgi:hypothetical protein
VGRATHLLPRALLVIFAGVGAALPLATGNAYAANPVPATGAARVSAGPGSSGYVTAPVTARSRPQALSPGQISQRTAVSPPHLVLPPHAASAGAARTATSAPRVQTITSVNARTAAVAPGLSNVQSLITHDQEVAFDGLNVAPPDTQLAAGPNHLMAVVNDLARIINRTTSATLVFDTNTFFKVPNGFIASDPKIVFDAASGRWYLSTLAFDGVTSITFDSYVFLAVSTSSDPTASWTIYGLLDQHASHMLCDQPHLGFTDDKITITCDEFGSNGFFQGDILLVVDKTAALNGTAAAEYVQAFPDTNQGSLQPVYSTTSTTIVPPLAVRPVSIQYIVWMPSGGYGIMAVMGNPAQQNIGWAQARVAINSNSLPPRAAESGTTSTIDTGDLRLDSAVYQSGVIWAAGGDSCIPNGDTVQRACLKLFQIKVSGFPFQTLSVSVTEDFDVGMFVQGTGDYLYYPAVTMDRGGTTYISYTESSTADLPTVYVSDIIAANAGAIDQTVLVQVGAGAYVGPASAAGGSRFGDYSAAAPDPNESHTVWIAGEVGAYEMNHLDDWGTVGASFSVPPCNSVTLSAAPPSPTASGNQIVFTAAASGCSKPLYQFWILAPGGSWKIVQAFSPTATFSWTTTGLLAGKYLYTVWARDSSSAGTTCNQYGCYDALFPGTAYTLTTTPCTSLGVTAGPASSQASGTPVTFTGTASVCPNPLYQFWILAPGGSWKIVQAFSPTATFNWNTTGLLAGNYLYTVWVRNSSSPGTTCNSYGCFDALFPGTAYMLTSTPCASLAASASPASPQGSGVPVTFTGTASGCPHPIYQFWILAPGGSWKVAQAFSTTATFNWNTTGLVAGNYLYTIWVRDSGSAGTTCNSFGCYDAIFPGTAYMLTTTPCASLFASASPASPQVSSTPVTFTGVASGCPHPLYQFWILAPGGSWKIVQAYSTTATFNWNTTGLPAGTYMYTVWVRDSGSAGSTCNSFGCYDAIFPGTAYTLT